jgi:hypothetical protein
MRRLLAFLAILTASSGGWAADWPQWRGAGRDNVWHETGLPDMFPATLETAHRRRLLRHCGQQGQGLHARPPDDPKRF